MITQGIITAAKGRELFNAAVNAIDSKSIREWAQSDQNRSIWQESAEAQVRGGKSAHSETDVSRFAAYIVCIAIGA